jgi:hypothetical protein
MSSKFDGKRVYELWMAARAHYLSDSYDILKYHWVFKIKDETFRIHKDRFLFERLAREYETEPVFKLALGAFFYDNPKGYLRKLIRPNFVVDQALARHDLLYINFAADYCKFQLSSAGLARLIEIDEISPESAAIIYDLNPEKYPLSKSPIRKIKNLPLYSAFIGYDKAKVFAIINQYQKATK